MEHFVRFTPLRVRYSSTVTPFAFPADKIVTRGKKNSASLWAVECLIRYTSGFYLSGRTSSAKVTPKGHLGNIFSVLEYIRHS